MRFIDAFKKPRYLKFTIMKYKDWKLRWDYKPTDNCERYDIVNIYGYVYLLRSIRHTILYILHFEK
jgi:hypothetical protein